jgi:mannosyltransferase OCH1-like enzyme
MNNMIVNATRYKFKPGLRKKEISSSQEMQSKIYKQLTNQPVNYQREIQEKLQRYHVNKIEQNVHLKLNINKHVNMHINLKKTPPIEQSVAVPIKQSVVARIEQNVALPIKPNIDKQIIPLNLFQTWRTLDLPENMRKAVNTLKTQNSEFTHYLYDDNMCREFIKNNFNHDVLYAFDKLTPTAYKADLWRYCVLYIYGGIYLDIKYNCINNFKLINLTDREYWVRDRNINTGAHGIYQALLICLPNNEILFKSIYKIVENVKNNFYGSVKGGFLMVTGPLLMSNFFSQKEILTFELNYNDSGTYINYNNAHILKEYDNYREEQKKTQIALYYADMWNSNNVYHYATLKSVNKIVLTRTINKIINGKNIKLFASNPAIIKDPNDNNQYIVNIRWINYEYNEDGSKKVIPNQWVSLNSRFIMNSQFEQMTDEIFLQEDYAKEKKYHGIGLEDIRLFNYLGAIYFSSTYFDSKRNITSSCCGTYNFNLRDFKLDRNIILPTFYDVNNDKKVEKNWSYMIYNNDLMMVYNWYPLIISKPDFNNNTLNVVKTVLMPDFFKIIRGSTPGFTVNDEIWFVVHTARKAVNNNNKMQHNYQHCFVIFNLNMELVRYSELFKFDDCAVEFCIGLIIEETRTILSYSSLDTNSRIGVYDNEYLKTGIKWFDNNAKTIEMQ